jgi:GST-like protein
MAANRSWWPVSGAILQYLAEKAGQFVGAIPGERGEVMQWLFWQMGGLGPIGGQLWHFRAFAPIIAPEFDNSFAFNRNDRMFARIRRTMDKRLVAEPYLAGAYSITDMACCPKVAYLAPGRRDRCLSPRPPLARCACPTPAAAGGLRPRRRARCGV